MVTVGFRRQGPFTRGRIHAVREDHDVEFKITSRDEDYNLLTRVVSGWI